MFFEAKKYNKMNQDRAGHKLINYKEKLYAVGGFKIDNGVKVELNSIEVLDLEHPESGWKELAPMITARSQFSAYAISNSIFVFGGFDGNN